MIAFRFLREIEGNANKISLISFTIKNPPDEIIVKAKLNASKDLKLMIL